LSDKQRYCGNQRRISTLDKVKQPMSGHVGQTNLPDDV
jgi:hypothetical protein